MVVERKTYNVRDIAKILNISVPAAYDLVHAEKGIPHIRIGERRIVVVCEQFDKWLEEAANAPKR